MRLVSNATANLLTNAQLLVGTIGMIYAFGTFANANVQIECSPDNLNFFSLPELKFQASGFGNVRAGMGWLRANISNTTANGVPNISVHCVAQRY